MSSDVAIVGSGGANIASLQFALQRLGATAILTTDARELTEAARIILPGVGAAADAIERLQQLDLVTTLRRARQPVLGICLGMQLLGAYSAEDEAQCLGITHDACQLLTTDNDRPVPHMGWNTLTNLGPCPLLNGVDDNAYVYFVHSYAMPVSTTTAAQCSYGQPFSAVIQHNNFFGTQFHPERSATTGAKILNNFLTLPS